MNGPIRQFVDASGPTRLLIVLDVQVEHDEVLQIGNLLRERFPDVEFTFLTGATVVDLGPALGEAKEGQK